MELFEREAKVLKNLDHPSIPKYLDFFTSETESDTEFYLVQEYVEGKSLAQFLQEGKHFTERDALKITLEIVRILEYLHSFSPPLIHRDIKPGNILLSTENRTFLIDFGSVRDKMIDDIYSDAGMPTMVGTFGYMPIEQAEGRTVPGSDIYSLGMTLIAVLSHQDPASMSRKGLRVDFRPSVNISSGFAEILERMVEPDWQQRYRNASELRRALEHILAAKTPMRPRRTIARRPVLWFISGVSLLLFMAFGIGFYLTFSDSGPAEQPETSVMQPSRTTSPETPPVNAIPSIQNTALPEVMTPTLPASSGQQKIFPIDGKIQIELYRDFTYIPKGWPMGLSVGQTSAGGLDTLAYERLKAEPRYRSNQVLYGFLTLGNGGDQQISFALDEIDQPNWVTYVDKNNNEDLTDDGSPYRNEGSGVFAANIKVMIEILKPSGETTVQPYDLWMWVQADRQSAKFYARCHYAAQLSVDDRLYEMIVFEQFHHDGLYQESGLWLDLNQDQQLNEATEHFSDGDVVSIASKTFQIELFYP